MLKSFLDLPVYDNILAVVKAITKDLYRWPSFERIPINMRLSFCRKQTVKLSKEINQSAKQTKAHIRHISRNGTLLCFALLANFLTFFTYVYMIKPTINTLLSYAELSRRQISLLIDLNLYFHWCPSTFLWNHQKRSWTTLKVLSLAIWSQAAQMGCVNSFCVDRRWGVALKYCLHAK